MLSSDVRTDVRTGIPRTGAPVRGRGGAVDSATKRKPARAREATCRWWFLGWVLTEGISQPERSGGWGIALRAAGAPLRALWRLVAALRTCRVARALVCACPLGPAMLALVPPAPSFDGPDAGNHSSRIQRTADSEKPGEAVRGRHHRAPSHRAAPRPWTWRVADSAREHPHRPVCARDAPVRGEIRSGGSGARWACSTRRRS